MESSELMAIERQRMVKGTISNAKYHVISLQHGKPNLGLGDCAIESVIFNINERSCYQYKYPM